MKRLMMTALASSLAIAVATPASAVVLVAGAAPVVPTAGAPTGPGSVVGTGTFNGVAATFSATVKYAVYLNTGNTYDFYFQVTHNGAGSTGNNQPIRMLTLSDYTGFTADAYAVATDPDGAGFFTAANNPTPAGGSTTGASLDTNGVVTFNFRSFGLNDLVQGETSATYVVRTNATNYNAFGSFGVIDGSSISSLTFEPAAGVPEPATWGMMIAGFGLMGGVLRRRKATVAFA